MKKVKPILSVFLSIIIVLSSAIPVFAYGENFDVRPSITLDKDSYSSEEGILIHVSMENYGDSTETVVAEFSTTSSIIMDTRSDVVGTVFENEQISKDYNAVASVSSDTLNWFQKTSMTISNAFYAFIYILSSVFQKNTDCVVLNVNGYSAAIMVKAIETETPKYTVDFELNYDSAEKIPTQEVFAKSKVEAPAMPLREGYSFAGWYKDSSLTTLFDFNDFIESNTTLYAAWTKDTVFYSVTFIQEEGNSVVVPVKEATTVEEPVEPEKEGFIFDGWFESGSTECFDFSSPIVKDTTLYAHWIEDIFGDVQYTVTFVWNDGITEEVYDTQIISPNKKATKPLDPEKENAAFMGWYLDPATTERFDFASRINADTILYAKWGSPEGEDGIHSSTEGGETLFSITDLEIENNNAVATINANEMCALVIRFFNEVTNEEIHLIATQTPDYCEMTKVYIPINYDLPDYFKVTVGLYNAYGELVCNEYVSIEFTSAYEEFKSLTVNDFEGQTVLNFDNSIDNNFGVLNENVIQIQQDDNINVLTTYSSIALDDSGNDLITYSFANYDSQISELESGNVILALDSDGAYQLIKVGYIEVEDDELVIYPATESQLSDFYDVIKVDTFKEDLAFDTYSFNTMDSRGVDIIDVDTTLPSATLSPLNLNWKPQKWLTVNGTAAGSAKVDIELVYNLKLFGKDYFKAKIETVTEIEVSVSVMASTDNSDDVKEQMKEKYSKELNFAKIPIPTPITGLSVVVKAGVTSEIKVEGGVKFTFNSKTTSGFSYDTNSGRQDIDKKEREVNFLKAEGKIEYKIGPKMSIGIAFLGTIVEASVEAQAGAKITVSADILNLPNYSTAEEKHACTSCFKVEARWFVEVSVKLEYEVNDWLSGEVFNLKIIELEGQILFGNLHSAYASVVHSADSVFGTIAPEFGFGECPNKTYRTTIKLVNSSDEEITGTNISIQKINGKFKSNGKSTFVDYLYDGQYSVSTKINGTSVSKTFVVSGSAQEIKLRETSGDGKISGKICSAKDNSVIKDATIIISKDSLIIKSLKSDSNGQFTVSLPDGVYCVKITKSNYITFTEYVTVEDSNTTYLNTALLVSGNSSERGGFSGKITDAVTGDPVKGAKLTIREGWNNPAYGDVVATIETDANGLFKYDITEWFGVIFGLESGNYTATVSKSGYATSSFDLVVLPGEVKGGQNAVIAPTAQGNYRIVLSWGYSPSDLDSHLTAYTDSGSFEHIYYRYKQGYTANLDLDDTDSYGPETITVTDFDDLNGGFTYAVHDYSNRSSSGSKTLSSSNAIVKLYKGNTLLKTYYVPTDKKGTVWRVFSVDESGEITDLNYFYNESTPEYVK